MEFKNYEKLIYILGIVSLIIGSVSCSSSTDPYKPFVGEKEIIYPNIGDTVIAISGINSVLFKVPKPTDPLAKKVGFFWNQGNDSLKTKFPDGKDTLQIKINDLKADQIISNYTFHVYTYDTAGNKSVGLSKTVEVYGENYASTVSNRILKSMLLIPGTNTIFLKWGKIPGGAVGTIVRYTNFSNKSDSSFVPVDSTRTQISNYKYKSDIKYNTLYTIGIDTISTSYQPHSVDQTHLLNAGPNFEHAEWNRPYGNPKYWKVNKAGKNRKRGFGGYRYLRQVGYLGLRHYKNEFPIIINGKVYKNLSLRAGTYSFSAFFEGTYGNFKVRGDDKAYIAIARGDSLPDIQDMGNNAIAYKELKKPNTKVRFTLNKKTNITLGLVATMRELKEYIRISKVQLRVK